MANIGYMEKAYKVIVLTCIMIHLILSVVFLQLDNITLSIYNMVVTLFYIGLLYVVYKKHFSIASVLIHMEVCIFVIVHSLMLGMSCNFSVYLFAMASVAFFNPFKFRYGIVMLTMFDLMIYFGLLLYSVKHPYFIPSHSAYTEEFAVFNSMFCFFIIIVGEIAAGISSKNIKRFQHNLLHDNLTGLYGREYFFEKVRQCLDRYPNETYWIFISNISELRIYNEVFGIEKGDEVLLANAKILRANANPKMVYGRISGDEFGVLVPDDESLESMVKSYVKCLEQKFSNNCYRMIVHVGAYKLNDLKEQVASMCEKARIAMDNVKGQYESAYGVYDDDLFAKITNERKLIGEFSNAIKERQFCIFLQPQMRSQGEAIGAEALVRWKHPEQGLISPDAFIPVFERVGLICELDMYVWEEAVKVLRRWQDMGQEDMYISVNISVKDFQNLDLIAIFSDLLKRYEINPKRLKLEITESVMMNDINSILDTFSKLQKLGFEIEIDDFGSGYSSFNMLKEICANVLKLDMGFLSKTENIARSQMILQSIITLSGELGMEVVAEGVEELEQVQQLRSMGCDLFQGYYFSRPIEVSEFEEKYVMCILT